MLGKYTPKNGKLSVMSQSTQSDYKSAGLVFNAATGEVAKARTQQVPVRLSPVNKRVLLTLLHNAGQVVSRQQLFDDVWPNQVVSDDALTRCISDLRSQLKPLAAAKKLIETIPKTGYRWLPPLQTLDQNHIPERKLFKPIITGIFLSLVLLWGMIGVLVWWSKPTVVPLVILPTEYKHMENGMTINVADQLRASTQQQGELKYLSEYAFEAHKGNPFPYFSHEFGVRWFIESQIQHQSESNSLTLNLIDARTALVIYSTSAKINDEEDIREACETFIQFIASL